jgi:hypothetical protein
MNGDGCDYWFKSNTRRNSKLQVVQDFADHVYQDE